VSLAKIIRATKARGLLEQFLLQPTPHPLDVQRLDMFIRHVASGRARVDLADLEQYLLGRLGTTKCAWVMKRIRIGVGILRGDGSG
jgi:hypothetical protein